MNSKKTLNLHLVNFGQHPYRILMIEDSFSDAYVFQRFLNREIGSSKIIWTHAQLVNAAIDILKSQHFDLLISDLSLPDGVGGLDTVRRLNKQANGIPIIVLTGFVDKSMRSALQEIPIQAYLLKDEYESKSTTNMILRVMDEFRREKQLQKRGKIGKKNVLLLDANYTSYALIQQVLYHPKKGLSRYFDCELLHALSLADAENILNLYCVDVLFCDLDGVDVKDTPKLSSKCDKSPNSTTQMPYLIGIGSKVIDDKLLMQFGYDEYLRKPFQIMFLVEYLSDLFDEGINE